MVIGVLLEVWLTSHVAHFDPGGVRRLCLITLMNVEKYTEHEFQSD